MISHSLSSLLFSTSLSFLPSSHIFYSLSTLFLSFSLSFPLTLLRDIALSLSLSQFPSCYFNHSKRSISLLLSSLFVPSSLFSSQPAFSLSLSLSLASSFSLLNSLSLSYRSLAICILSLTRAPSFSCLISLSLSYRSLAIMNFSLSCYLLISLSLVQPITFAPPSLLISLSP